MEGIEDIVADWPRGIPLPRALETLYAQHVAAAAGEGGAGRPQAADDDHVRRIATSPYALLAMPGEEPEGGDPTLADPGQPGSEASGQQGAGLKRGTPKGHQGARPRSVGRDAAPSHHSGWQVHGSAPAVAGSPSAAAKWVSPW